MSLSLTTLGCVAISAAIFAGYVCTPVPPADHRGNFSRTAFQTYAESERSVRRLTGLCDLTAYNDKLFAGGVFDSAGGVLMDHITAWDGVSRAPLGDGNQGLLRKFNIRRSRTDENAVACPKNTTPDIRNGIFEKKCSSAIGGSFRMPDASQKTDHCVIDGNHAGTGGAIAGGGTGGPTPVSCTFVAKRADGLGGGLFASGEAPSVTNCTFAPGTGRGRMGMDDDIPEPPFSRDLVGRDYRCDGLSPCPAYNNNRFAIMGAYGLGYSPIRGNISNSGPLTVGDVVTMIDYLFRGGRRLIVSAADGG